MKINKLKPIIRCPGSKFKMLNKIFEKFNDFDGNKKFVFIEPFGGSLIVGANVAYNFPEAKVFINDFDKFINESSEFDKAKLITNQQSYSGFGNKTDATCKQFEIRIKNGYWNLVQVWNNLINNNLYFNSKEWVDFINYYLNDWYSQKWKNYFFFDPPYYGKKYQNLYKSKVNHNFLFACLNFLKVCNPNFKILISLNDCEFVRKFFSNWKIEEIPIIYTLTSNNNIKKTKELLISNF